MKTLLKYTTFAMWVTLASAGFFLSYECAKTSDARGFSMAGMWCLLFSFTCGLAALGCALQAVVVGREL